MLDYKLSNLFQTVPQMCCVYLVQLVLELVHNVYLYFSLRRATVVKNVAPGRKYGLDLFVNLFTWTDVSRIGRVTGNVLHNLPTGRLPG